MGKHTVKHDRFHYCDGCIPLDREVNLFQVKETKHFPSLGSVSKARVAELDRRIQIKDSTVGAGYRIGRRMENGRIAEKNFDDLIRD